MFSYLVTEIKWDKHWQEVFNGHFLILQHNEAGSGPQVGGVLCRQSLL
jgi:hypothetical protein